MWSCRRAEAAERVGPARRPFGVSVLGGPTTVIDIGGRRVVADPTFDPPGDYGLLHKTAGPAVGPDALGAVDVVLVSHDVHADNLDHFGRAFAGSCPVVLAPPTAAARLSGPARPLATGHTWTDGQLQVTAVPARHGPADAELNDEGFVLCEVAGFLLEAPGAPRTYVSGDNASLELVAGIARQHGPVDCAVLFAGAAALAVRFGGRPLTLTAQRAAAAAEVLGAGHVVLAHQDSWQHFRDGPERAAAAFGEAGISGLLCTAGHGQWCAPG